MSIEISRKIDTAIKNAFSLFDENADYAANNALIRELHSNGIRITSEDNYNERNGRQTRTVTVYDMEIGMELRKVTK